MDRYTMHATPDRKKINFMEIGQFLLPILLFVLILVFEVPYALSGYVHRYSIASFLIVLLIYYLAFRLPKEYRVLACFGWTMLLFALTLSFLWTSGYSDNKVIAGFLPYKDGAGYYLGANLILNGLPLENTLQAGWRPLFPGFLSSLLFLTGGNLKLGLAVLVMFAGLGTYFASRQVYAYLGAFPASLFITFLYFYIQPLIGLTMTELLGFTMGCLAFSMLWIASLHPRMTDLLLGILLLVLAMSVRAGTFFMLPLVTIWAGRIFRGTRNFSWRAFAVSWVVILLGYFAANTLFARLVGVPEGELFGNFAYSLYGQVQGGTGWHRAIEELGTRNPSVIYRAAFQFFLEHPFSLVIGTAKSYRDFFLPGGSSIFPFIVDHSQKWIDYLAWGAVVLLIVRGLINLIKSITQNLSLLLLAGFTGIFLSIPFLPPIDGGARFYASTIPFFFILPVVGLGRLPDPSEQEKTTAVIAPDGVFLRTGAVLLSLLTVVTPLLILNGNSTGIASAHSCSDDQTPFVTRFNAGSYVDLVMEEEDCGLLPDICLTDFEKHGTEKKVDDFYQAIYSLSLESRSGVRVLPAPNFLDNKLKYFFISKDDFPDGIPQGPVAGCAVVNRTQNQTIYQVKSIFQNREEPVSN